MTVVSSRANRPGETLHSATGVTAAMPAPREAAPAAAMPVLPGDAPRAARAVLRLLSRLSHGRLLLTLPDGSRLAFGSGEPAVALRLASWQPLSAALARGDVGFAESWIEGQWECDSLIEVLDLALANRRILDQAIHGHGLGRLVDRLRHLLRRNSRAGSRRNIHAHYDLGNAFYRLWLDDTMTYSSALFGGNAALPLARAQQAKYRRILDQLALPAGARVLEIGCGWGGFAEQAARAGLRLKGLTLSTEQLAFARERLASAGLADIARCELQDYRDEHERYDGIASIEMFEAVGEAYWPRYFDTVARALAPGGRAVIQTIVIDDALFERYRRGTDFIQQYVFPGGMLPSPSAFTEAAARAGLRVIDRFAFGQDYAQTLARWRETFMAQLDTVRAQGFDRRFIRTWEFYLAYCEAAFRHRSTDVIQFTLVREENRP
jgi:cyclopropane-fatty-acyl-phospholipid synthase